MAAGGISLAAEAPPLQEFDRLGYSFAYSRCVHVERLAKVVMGANTPFAILFRGWLHVRLRRRDPPPELGSLFGTSLGGL